MNARHALRELLSWPGRRVLEPLEGYWLGDPSWGQVYAAPVTTAGLGAPGQIVPVARLDRIPGPPRPYTIRLYRTGGVLDAVSGAGAYAGLRARITVGSGGQTTQFAVDWAHGTQFTVVASSIVVDAVQEGVLNVSPATPIAVGAAFGQGACSRGNATFTLMPAQVPVPGALAFATFAAVPQYATHVEVYATTDTGFPGGWFANRDPLNSLEQQTFANAAYVAINTFADPELRTYPGVRLIPEANQIWLRSRAGAVQWTECTVVFNLTCL
jgi:hypothetical protein